MSVANGERGTEEDKKYIAQFLSEIGGKAPEFAEKFVSRQQLLECSSAQMKRMGLPVGVRKSLLKKRDDLAMRGRHLNMLRMWRVRTDPTRYTTGNIVDGDARLPPRSPPVPKP